MAARSRLENNPSSMVRSSTFLEAKATRMPMVIEWENKGNN